MLGARSRCFIAAAGLLLLAGSAQAGGSNQTWVASFGTDTGNCPQTAPCRTFRYAITKTPSLGVLSVIDSADYGPVTITKSVSILAIGAEGAIFDGAPAAVTVNGTNIEVWLRGLTIDLFGLSQAGIVFTGGSALHIQDCTIRGTTYGIDFVPKGGASELYVSDSLITNTRTHGIMVAPNSNGSVKAVFTRVHVENAGGHGFTFSGAGGGINAVLNDSVAAGNHSNGINVQGGAGSPVQVMVDRSASVGNTVRGVFANGALVRIGDSTVTGNQTGLAVTGGGTIASYSSNKVNGNVNDGAPTTVSYK
ncbi:MAG TPA: right-handed parallel beta-helix repeat-containing protein [Pseudolabrys sp.]|nr:right-handed parallel beta-helix repeat-containing protein [Pseudolabrys sp.]